MARYPQTILATCCIPWYEDGTLAKSVFRSQIRYLIDRGISDLYIFGTAGEGYAVDDQQFDRIVRIFTEEMTDRGAEPMVGVISLSLRTILERIAHAGSLGVRAFQISLPSWGALTEKEVMRFFDEVCGQFPEFQFLHYNLARTKRLVTADEYAVIARKHQNLVATKFGSRDLESISNLLLKVGELRHFLTEFGFAYGSTIGECGFLVSIASSNPRRAREYFDAGVKRDFEKLAALHQELLGMADALHRAVGTSGAHMDGAYDKIFCKLHDPQFPLRLLPPYLSARDEDFNRYRDVLIERYPQWLDQGD